MFLVTDIVEGNIFVTGLCTKVEVLLLFISALTNGSVHCVNIRKMKAYCM